MMLLIKNNLFFIKKMSQNVWATIMSFGPVTLIFYWPKKNFTGPKFFFQRSWPSFQAPRRVILVTNPVISHELGKDLDNDLCI